MKNVNNYFGLAQRRNFEGLICVIENDLQEILEISPSKRTVKQKKAINYLQQLLKAAHMKKVNFLLIEKLTKL